MADDILAELVNVIEETEEKTVGYLGHKGGAHLTPTWVLRAAVDEIARLRKERLTADERAALELSLELEWPKTGRQWKALAACLGPVCVAPANEHKVAIRGLLDRQPLPPGPEAAG